MTDRKICGAKNRQGQPCTQRPLQNGRCRFHGGMSLVGPALPQFKHGRHSVLLKEIGAFGQHYQHALADPDLLRLDSEIALVDARLSELLDRCSQVKGDKARLTHVDQLWPQLEALIEQRRKLVDTESKRLKDLHAMVSLDRVNLIVSYLADAVRRHVKDPKEQTAIYNDLRKLLKPGDGHGE